MLLGALALGTRAWAGPADQAPALLLAQPWQPGTDLTDWWVSEKYDGVRGFWDGRTLRTRGGERIA
ncbi:MAG TPA: DNA ligase, partial [Ottowia sp.]|nr:DNA ligase [Ottowia sp.]